MEGLKNSGHHFSVNASRRPWGPGAIDRPGPCGHDHRNPATWRQGRPDCLPPGWAGMAGPGVALESSTAIRSSPRSVHHRPPTSRYGMIDLGGRSRCTRLFVPTRPGPSPAQDVQTKRGARCSRALSPDRWVQELTQRARQGGGDRGAARTFVGDASSCQGDGFASTDRDFFPRREVSSVGLERPLGPGGSLPGFR